MGLFERRAVLKEVPPRERRQQIQDYAAGRPLSPDSLASLQRWAGAYPPIGWMALGIGVLLAFAFVVPLFARAEGRWLVPAVALGLWLFWMYQAIHHLRIAARLRREAAQVPLSDPAE